MDQEKNSNLHLPNSVSFRRINGKNIYFIGTAHVSKKSVEDVKEVIQTIHPDTVAVELCPARMKAMTDNDKWKNMDLFKVIKEGKAALLISQLILSSFYQRIGKQLDVQPGAEMMEGILQAEAIHANLCLADRSIDITLKRIWRNLSFFKKIKLASNLIASMFYTETVDAQTIEDMKEENHMNDVMDTVAQQFPQLKVRLIDERDLYLAEKIRSAPGETIVAVVGAGHVPGILKAIDSPIDLKSLEALPQPSLFSKFAKWLIPLIFLSVPIYSYFFGSIKNSIDSIYIWVISHAILAGIGAAFALAHPLAILAGSLAAPFTSLNPMIAAGWFAGLVQAWIKKPTVADLENLPIAIASPKGFWSNPASRILLVVVLANLGSSLGTFICGSWLLTSLM